MQKIILFLVLTFSTLSANAQKEILLRGTITFENKPMQGIEIVNSNNRAVAVTNANGDYQIKVKQNDLVVILTKLYTDRRILMTSSTIQNGVLDIQMYSKPIALDDVEIKKRETIVVRNNYNDMKMESLNPEKTDLKNRAVYTGEIPMGMDFIQIGKMIGKLFKKKKSNSKDQNAVLDFESYVESNIDQEYFAKALDLKSEEVNRFLEYCKNDPKSKTFTENTSVLEIMDFLLIKKAEFKKL
ncbi:MAG: hypothetical protein ACI9XR_002178 [Flavobacterium sp.]|jgi:hypothetical protein